MDVGATSKAKKKTLAGLLLRIGTVHEREGCDIEVGVREAGLLRILFVLTSPR